MDYSNKNNNRKLIASMQLINVFIGVILALICVFAYITIENMYIRILIISLLVIGGVICFVNLFEKLNKQEVLEDSSNITEIKLVNEENQIIKNWNIENKIAFIIGKNINQNDVFIDLNNSIYSNDIEVHHSVLNYAGGKWYIEDISLNGEVCIQKIDDNKKYRIVKNTPCELKKGDVLFINKIKLLLK